MHVKKDKSCSTLGVYRLQHQVQGKGKAPSLWSQTGWLALQVSGNLQEAAARPGCYCLPSRAQEGTQTPSEGSKGSGMVEWKGPAVQPWGTARQQYQAQSNSEVKCLQEHCSPPGSEALQPTAVFKFSFCLGKEINCCLRCARGRFL